MRFSGSPGRAPAARRFQNEIEVGMELLYGRYPMKNRMCAAIVLAAGIFAFSGSIFAHHGTGISYDLTIAPITTKAVVTEFKWANPHIGIYVDIKDDTGHVENWSIEGNSPYNWARMGWNRKTLQVGQEITLTFYRSKVPGVHAGVIAKAVLPDGTEVLRFQRDTPTQGDGVR
jgi:hypothetical protein